MIKSAIHIPKDKFSGSLRIELFKIAKMNPESSAAILLAITDCELSETAFKNLAQQPGFKLPIEKFENLELTARINDIKFTIGRDKVNSIQVSVNAYRDLYIETENIAYLVRALQLIKKTKAIFENQLNDLSIFLYEEILKEDSSHNQLALLKSSLFLSDTPFKDKLKLNFFKKFNECIAKNRYHDARNYIEMLYEIGFFDKSQYHIELSQCLEKEADHHVSQKQPNTYYPTILSLYTDSLKQLKGVSVSLEVRTRIEQKVKNEQLLHTEMLRKVGVSLDIEMDISQDVASLNINDFQTGFEYLMDLPIIDNESLEFINQNKEQNFLSELFGSYVHYTPKGTVSGISNADQFYLNLARNRYRDLQIKILQEIKWHMDLDKLITKESVAGMINNCQSRFIPADREHVFIEGIYAGFQNNYITASHLLLPQIENSLKIIMESSNRNVTKLTDEIQNDNTLGGILSLEENSKMLDGICNRNLLAELNSFLVDGSNVNFRNQLCHGLMTPILINHYGLYLWWLVIKMVKQTNHYFHLPVK
ncbi:DUF4209 domain-containing protein [Flavobacterium sp.]|uniref:DUF4209 domain-containing protein n=1 Tax=Flavobacterium sp. TaxID=239 RepID=UPI004033DF17